MKKLYFLVAFTISLLCNAQTILNQPETTTRTVQDPQAVILTTGFRAVSSTSNPFIAKVGASTDTGSTPIDSGAGSGNPSGTTDSPSNKFHDTQGNIDVTGGGQLQYTLPIALPPGIKSVAPQVNLVYTSGSGNGIAGYGWSLPGVTSISRIGKTIEIDGTSKGLEMNNTDYYSFNGQRLILKNGTYGADGAEYVTEKYSNIKIKSVGQISSSIPLYNGPKYWEVTFEDGSQAYYGGQTQDDTNSITPNEYYIVKWKDPQGNYISYSYDITQQPGNFDIFTGQVNLAFSYNVARVTKILWGGNENLNKIHFNEIDFNYIDRELKESAFVNGIQFIQDKLLSNIVVKSNNSQFKKYEISYKQSNTKYQFVDSIVEKNSANEDANPVRFENQTDNFTQPNTFAQNSRFDDIYGVDVISADFDGDGKLDFLKGTTLMLSRLDGTGNFININYEGTPIAAGTGLKNGVMLNKQILYTSTIQDKILKVNSYVFNGTGLEILSTKNIDLTSFSDIFLTRKENDYYYEYEYNVAIKGTEGDFDGDGISEFKFRVQEEETSYEKVYDGWGNPDGTRTGQISDSSDISFYYNPTKNIFVQTKYISPDSKVADFNGNGKSDLFEIKDNNFNVYELNDQSQFVNIFSTTKESLNDVVYFGDFNGDGKTDIIAPIAEDSSNWRMYLSTGNGFAKILYSNLFLYKPSNQGPPRKNRNTQRTYATADLNKDGKSDFIIFESQVWFRDGWTDWNNPDSSYGFNYLRNEGVDGNGKPIFANIYHIDPKELNSETEDINFSKYGEHYIPLFGNFRISQLNTDFVIIHKTKLITWDLGDKINKLSKIISITQGGIKTDIEYSPLTNTGNIYKSYSDTNPLPYPYVNIVENVNYDVVSKLIQGNRKQDFRYRDMVGHLQGRGIIGFRQTARSTFYTDQLSSTKVWNGSEINPLNEALPIKDWSVKTTSESEVFPTNISLTNTQLLSFKQYEYKIDKILNGNKVTTFIDADKPKIVTAINPWITTSKDFQKDIKSVHTVLTYNDIYLPTKSTTDINDGFALTTTELSYKPPVTTGNTGYAIGKPEWKTESVTAYKNTVEGKESYEYNGALLINKKTYDRNKINYIEENYTYDGFGNVLTKEIKNPSNLDLVKPTTTQSEYEDKGRFVILQTDNLGLKTDLTYNDWGLLLTQKDPSGNLLTNTYDAWGKLLTSKTNLGGTTTYTYEKFAYGDTKVTSYAPDNSQSITYTNKLGQTYKSTVKGFNQGKFVSSEVQYDDLGRRTAESEPSFEGSLPKWTTTDYDDYSRPLKITSSIGRITENVYNGREATATETNANNRFKKQVFDPLGNLTSSTDKGGTINYSYNAAGDNIESKYGTNSVTTKYDEWGRKIEFLDPSNGLYKYSYNGYGQLIEVESKKGHKYYKYNDNGQLYNQIESSADTDKNITFEYDPKGQIIKKYGTSKGQTYSSYINYDTNGRVISSGENSNGSYYLQKDIQYDDKARIVSYEKSLYSSSQYTKVNIENVYNNWDGELFQLKDKTSGKILWELKEINARGQVKKVNLGGTSIENMYDDSKNFLSAINHTNTVTGSTVLYVGYNFNAIKNELNSRNTLGNLNISETFEYDSNNRLTKWKNQQTGLENTNTYDDQGRITQNDQVGTIKFENSANVYQATSATLNTNGVNNYTNDLIQKISYNENNDPIFIDGLKGDVLFSYGLTAMRQKVTFGGNFGETGQGNHTKYYSEDGSYEITVDNVTGKEKVALFIGGDPYSSSIVFMKDYNESAGSYKFLHKDYLGSILAITNENGDVLEQRHFDAWGNITLFKVNGVDKDLSKFSELSLLSRGYTSHEHFSEVGIIHMNGRLYDPLLRRFLNADENIQDPSNTQNYNKYGYVLNNPLLFSDPTGEVMGWDDAIIAIGIAVFFSAATDYYLNKPVNLGNMFQSVIMSLMSAGIADGIGTVFQVGEKTANSLGTTGTIIARAGAHAIAQGALSYVQGGNFLSGALAGAFASVSNDLLGLATKNGGKFVHSDTFALITGAVSGGTGSVLGGGNFWVGAGQGLIVTAFNFLAHKPKTSFRVYDDDGDYVGKVKIDEYRSADYDGGAEGIVIKMSFTASGDKYDSFNWVQTVFTNDSAAGTNQYKVFNDPLPGNQGHDSSPYYWNKQDQIRNYNSSTNTYTFADGPYRYLNNTLKFNIYWRAELSLVGINGSGAQAIHTFKYGFNFNYQNKNFVRMPLQTIPYSGRYKWLK